ncbi:MAG TPA: hypothetical protein VMR50_13075 [Myxococcota bacterium]|nr:hypothetical protein [Myxococcota bacterium]
MPSFYCADLRREAPSGPTRLASTSAAGPGEVGGFLVTDSVSEAVEHIEREVQAKRG